MENIFINEAYTYAINEYIKNKNNENSLSFNTFYVVVIRMLCKIYDELDIITPYKLKDEEMFFLNLQKYGYLISNIVEFNETFLDYYQKEEEKSFIKIQKMLIDMFVKKKVSLNVTDKEINDFRSLIYSPYSLNPLFVAYNYKIANNSNEVINYCDEMFDKNKKETIVKTKKTLSIDAYKMLNYTQEGIDQMTSEELDEVNKKVYNYFNINENAMNKDYLLDKAVFDLNNPKPSFSTGNGYIDIIFILAIIATLIMLIFIITLLIS